MQNTFTYSGGAVITIQPNDATKVIDTSTGAYLGVDGNWHDTSDRARKENLTAVDTLAILRTLAAVPVQAWNYKVNGPSVQHLGPMAQDLYAAFRLGGDDKTICALDANGIALASIQGLYKVVQQKEAEIAALKKECADQRAAAQALERRLQALEAAAGK